MALSPIVGFGSYDAFQRTIRFLDSDDLFCLERVCKSWQKAAIDLRVLEDLLEAEKIPAIVGRRPNFKAYVVLRKMLECGVNVQKIEKYYGKPVGNMPLVSSEKYDLMFGPDPEEPTRKMFETYEAVFTPLAIKRTFGKGLAASVDEQGRLKITRQETGAGSEEYELEIPFSFANVLELSKYPLTGEGLIFDVVNANVLKQCKSATKAGIYFMRSNILEKSRNETYFEHEVRAQNIKQEIAPLIVRAFSNFTKILETGQCPDPDRPLTYARTADRVVYDNGSYHAALGSLDRDGGIICKSNDSRISDDYGFAPGVPTEAEAEAEAETVK